MQEARISMAKRVACVALAVLMVFGIVPIAEAESETAIDNYSALEEYKSLSTEELRELVEESEGEYVEDSIIVVYEEGAYEQSSEGVMTALDATESEVIANSLGNDGAAVSVEIPEGMSVADAVVWASEMPGVAYAQPNNIYYLLDTEVDDPIANVSDINEELNQWWLYSVDAFEAWDYSRVEGSVTVAILDTGFYFEHEDLENVYNTELAWDAYTQESLTSSAASSSYAHGIHVSGIVSGEANNGVGIAGISYNADILPIEVFYYDSYYGVVTTDTILIRAYNYIFDLIDADSIDNLRVINMSLGGYGSANQSMRAVIQEAQNDYNILTVAAGGNGDDYGNPYTAYSYPADYDEVVSVVALDSTNTRASWCDYNDQKNISAPGVDITSTYYGSITAYRQASGTSMASPLVAGVAAMLFAADPTLTVEEVKDVMYTTATDLGDEGRDDYYGYGMINPVEALKQVSGASVQVEDGSSSSVYRTQTVQLEAAAINPEKTAEGWTWTSSDTSIATVDSNGLVTAITAGSVLITATATNDSDITGAITITVNEIEIPDTPTSEGVSGEGILISWSAALYATSYTITRYDSPSLTDGSVIATVTEANSDGTWSYTDTTAEASSIYYYTITPNASANGVDATGTATQSVAGLYMEEITRLGGENRFETSSAVVAIYTAYVAASGSTTSTVIVTSGESYPDALAASGLAGALDAPIVLTSSSSLSTSAKDTLVSISPSSIKIVGGENTISADVQNAIEEAVPGATVTRIYGTSRQKTAQEIYDSVSASSWGKTAIIVSGSGYADALSISSYAYASASPIFLTDGDDMLTLVTRQRLLAGWKSGNIERVVIIGGESSVGTTVESQLENLGIEYERWSGSNRYLTSIEIAEHAVEEGVLSYDTLGFATGSGFADSLAAGALMGKLDGVLLLVDERSNGTAALDDLVSAQSSYISSVLIFGGSSSLSEDLLSRIAEAADLT